MDLVLYRFCLHSHSSWEFLGITAVPCPENRIFTVLSTLWLLDSLPSFEESLREDDRDISHLVLSTRHFLAPGPVMISGGLISSNTNKLFWPLLKTLLVYEYNNFWHLFIWKRNSSFFFFFFLMAMTFLLSHSLLTRFTVFLWPKIYLNIKAVGYLSGQLCQYFAPLNISCLTGIVACKVYSWVHT